MQPGSSLPIGHSHIPEGQLAQRPFSESRLGEENFLFLPKRESFSSTPLRIPKEKLIAILNPSLLSSWAAGINKSFKGNSYCSCGAKMRISIRLWSHSFAPPTLWNNMRISFLDFLSKTFCRFRKCVIRKSCRRLQLFISIIMIKPNSRMKGKEWIFD